MPNFEYHLGVSAPYSKVSQQELSGLFASRANDLRNKCLDNALEGKDNDPLEAAFWVVMDKLDTTVNRQPLLQEFTKKARDLGRPTLASMYEWIEGLIEYETKRDRMIERATKERDAYSSYVMEWFACDTIVRAASSEDVSDYQLRHLIKLIKEGADDLNERTLEQDCRTFLSILGDED